MKRNRTSFVVAGALLVAGAGLSGAQAQGSYAGGGAFAPGVNYDAAYGGYDYGWAPNPLGVLIAAPAILAAGVVGAAATLAAIPFAAAATLATAPLAAGYYADPYSNAGYYGVDYYGSGYVPVGWGYNYGPTYVAYRARSVVRRGGVVVTRGSYRSVRAIHGRPVQMRMIHNQQIHMRQVQAQPTKVTLAHAN